ncbi:hypothetical protein QCA50_013737 [Cerrena zonata]|uniref:Uncharacterized protein n=1 Tax=Cerrena zonata TaxID=2478898 RepID=A0AAW0G1Y9_9APHY
MGRVPKAEPKDDGPSQVLKPIPPQPQTDKATALKTTTGYRRASAWQIHRWPLRKHVMQEKSRVHFPRSYLAKDGMEIKVIWPGTDLNQFVHNHYAEPLDSGGGDMEVDESKIQVKSADFVTDDGVCPRKHEYLGPDPCVVGYSFDYDGDIHIKWWDSFLQDQWMDTQKWKFDVEVNDQGEWVPKDLTP